MAVFKHSRYTKLNIYHDSQQDSTYMDFPCTSLPTFKNNFMYQVRPGETIEFLANQFYGDSHLNWVILYANPSYTSPYDIKPGDLLTIPSREEVLDYVNGFEE